MEVGSPIEASDGNSSLKTAHKAFELTQQAGAFEIRDGLMQPNRDFQKAVNDYLSVVSPHLPEFVLIEDSQGDSLRQQKKYFIPSTNETYTTEDFSKDLIPGTDEFVGLEGLRELEGNDLRTKNKRLEKIDLEKLTDEAFEPHVNHSDIPFYVDRRFMKARERELEILKLCEKSLPEEILESQEFKDARENLKNLHLEINEKATKIKERVGAQLRNRVFNFTAEMQRNIPSNKLPKLIKLGVDENIGLFLDEGEDFYYLTQEKRLVKAMEIEKSIGPIKRKSADLKGARAADDYEWYMLAKSVLNELTDQLPSGWKAD